MQYDQFKLYEIKLILLFI